MMYPPLPLPLSLTRVQTQYNNGRGSIKSEPLCPDPLWPASDSSHASDDCWVGSSRGTM